MLFLFLALFLLVKAQQIGDFKICSESDDPDCTGLRPPGTVCYNGWVPGKKNRLWTCLSAKHL
jgi:hypothetical protein